MEKLTKERFAEIIRDKEICEFCEDCGNDEICINCEKVNPATVAELRLFWKELAALVKARDEGRVLISPIALEQKIYKHSPLKSGVLEWTVIQIMKSQTGFDFEIIANSGITHRVSDEDIGKTVFLTRAEAEAAIQKGGLHETDPV